MFRSILSRAPSLVAADGAADRALEEGVMPDLVIGDFDSLSPSARREIPSERLLHIAEQDSTDFEKCLTRIAAPLTFAVGLTGARLDHELAVFNTLVRAQGPRCIVVGKEDVVMHLTGPIVMKLPIGSRLSLFPMRPVKGRSTGLRWPIDGIDFAPGGRVGTSNEVASEQVSLDFDGSGMLLILPREALNALLAAL